MSHTRFAACLLLATVLPALAGGAALEGATWRLVSLPGHDAAALATIQGGVSVTFADGSLQAFAGCNRLRGSYAIEGDQLRLGPVAGTMMACPEPAMTVENAVKAALTGTPRFAVDGDRLTLTATSGADLVFERVPPPTLAGTSWEITGFNNGREAVVSPLLGTRLTLTFDAERVVGEAGCNGFRGTYTVEGDKLSIRAVASTRKACDGDGVMAQEHEYLTALETATRWTIERDLLDVHRADGQRVLTAKQIAH